MKYIFYLISLVITLNVFAQTQRNSQKFTVKGKVLEAATKQPLPYATFVITHVKSQRITGGITDQKGDFTASVPKGLYDMKVEFVGFKSKKLPQKMITTNLDLGTIFLAEDEELLEDVEVVAEKSTVEIKLDKKVYNVGKDMTVKGGNASDVLDNVPSVNVAADGTVSLRGNENVRILINGKPSSMVGLSGSDALRNLPANAIERVEVVTSPSARYDAEGTAGILNIILRKGKVKGFNGSITVSAGYPILAGLAGNLNYRAKKFNVFSNLSYNHRTGPGNAVSDFTYFDNAGEIIRKLNEKRRYDRKRNGYNGSIGMEYFLNDKSSLTGTFFLGKSNSKDEATNLIKTYSPDNVLQSDIKRIELEKQDDLRKQISLNYTNNIDKKGQKLKVDLQYSDGNEDVFADISENNISKEKDTQLTKSQNILAQLDYILPVGEKSQIELGTRNDLQDYKSNFQVRDGKGNLFTFDPSNNINFKQNVYAFYAQYGSKIKKFSYLLGLRTEITDIDLLLINTDTLIKKNYTQLFPTLNLGYKTGENGTLTFGYNRRLRRPRSWFLNPFESRSSNVNVFRGNPNLNPMYTSSFDLGYNTGLDKLDFGGSVYYQYSEDIIRVVTLIEQREKGQVFVRQPLNLNNENRIGFELNANWKITKKVRLSGSFNFYNFNIDAFNYTYQTSGGTSQTESLPKVSNTSWFTRFNARITLPAKIEWQTRVMYFAPETSSQGKRKSMTSVNLSFSKDLFKEKASIVFNVSDLFNSRKRRSSVETDKVSSYQEFQWRERQFRLAFTYRFNQKKKRPRRSGYDGGGMEQGGGF